MRSEESSLQSGEGGNEDGNAMGVGNVVKKSCKKLSKWLGETWGQYSHKVMDVFETSKLYWMIDEV